MDWPPKTPYPWDWETRHQFREKELVSFRPAQQPEWNFGDGHLNSSYGNDDNGSVYSSDGRACSSSEMGTGSSKSSISISTGSPPKVETIITEPIFNPVEQTPESLKQSEDIVRVETGSLHGVVALGGTQKPLIALKLGKRTYFEDVSGGSNITNSSSFASMNSSFGLIKKPKVMKQNMQNANCQVEGCNADLTTSKDYHRKHKVCESHSKSPNVIVDGQHCRFCQQCSRFHKLCDFDQNKRSCRRRLIEHNARRRKQRPEMITFGPSAHPTLCYGERQTTNLMFGQIPSPQFKNTASSTWSNTDCSDGIPTKGYWGNSSKSGGNNGHLHYSNTGISKDVSTRHDLVRLLPMKCTNDEVLDKGLGEPYFAADFDGAPDPGRAFSLLSTESSFTSNLESTSDYQFANANSVLSQPAIYPTNATSHILQQDELPIMRALPFGLQPDGGQFHDFQLHKPPCETHFLNFRRMH